MLTQERASNALGGKTTRACDSCLIKRARWFCAADDAFLCQACDTFVHSANQLANRHERVRLETSSSFSSSKSNNISHHHHELKLGDDDKNSATPLWHQGFTRKARTPRHINKVAVQQQQQQQQEVVHNINSLPLVPEISCEENYSLDENENEEQELLYRVPVFDPFDDKELNFIFLHDENKLHVENLLGTTLDNESRSIGAGLGEMQDIIREDNICIGDNKIVKIEDEDDEEVKAIIASHFNSALDSTRESFNWDFDYNSSSAMNGEEDNEMKMAIGTPVNNERKQQEGVMKKIFLKLNYEDVISAWDSQGCPWTNGTRPICNPDNCWPYFLGNDSSGTFQQPYGVVGGGRRDEEREARVSRYREKRRTRLFSKKIRYEVRKLNAEKRPRMKGRFVKRTSFLGSSSSNYFPNYLINKS